MLGALIGDIVGSRYEFNNIKTKEFNMFTRYNRITDDSVMTVAVAEMCLKGYLPNDKDKIIDTFKKWGKLYPHAGYGGMFYSWVLGENREPYNSYGNGAAMRVSPVGFVAQNVNQVLTFSKAVTEVTHNHKKGIKGAQVVAMCIYLARMGNTKKQIYEYARRHYRLDFDYEELKRNYSFDETCDNTVPQAIYCFLISKSFEDCIRTTISIGGDCDTTAAISGAIAEAYYGISEETLLDARDYIPEDMLKVINDFESKFHEKPHPYKQILKFTNTFRRGPFDMVCKEINGDLAYCRVEIDYEWDIRDFLNEVKPFLLNNYLDILKKANINYKEIDYNSLTFDKFNNETIFALLTQHIMLNDEKNVYITEKATDKTLYYLLSCLGYNCNVSK